MGLLPEFEDALVEAGEYDVECELRRAGFEPEPEPEPYQGLWWEEEFGWRTWA